MALDGTSLRVLVIDPPDRKQLDELGYTLSLTIEPIIVPEHRFVQAVELVYGVRGAGALRVAGGEAAAARDRSDARQADAVAAGAAGAAGARACGRPEPNAPMPVGERIKEGTPTEPQRMAPVHVRGDDRRRAASRRARW